MKDLKKIYNTSNFAFEWCRKKFGGNPKLVISLDKRVKRKYNEYYKKTILIYPYVCETYIKIIRTVIHEYIHYLQMPRIKDDFKNFIEYRENGYNNNLENEANYLEGIFYKECKNDFKKKL